MRRTIAVLTLLLTAVAHAQPAATKSPFPYLASKAYHILPETHNNESGYFAIVEGLDGKVYVGATKYGENAYLVEYDPKTEKQRVVVDAHAVTGATGKGFASQAKIHTKLYVGPSGKVYMGTKQGYPTEEDLKNKVKYPGGYVIVYDPKADKAESLGMPMATEGVIDVTADEARGLIYVVTCEQQHWMVYDVKEKKYREIDPKIRLAAYAATLVDKNGRASAITDHFQLAQYDPETQKVTVRNILVGDRDLKQAVHPYVPTWAIAADGRTAYVVMLDDPHLVAIDLLSEGPTVKAKVEAAMLPGKGHDTRSGVNLGPDGRVYVIMRNNNDTGYGTGYLHHIARFDPKTGKAEDLGVLTVRNPDFFAWTKPDGTKPQWSHGYHNLPDGTLTPLHGHQGMIVARDGTIYSLILYPYTLLRTDPVK